MPDSRPADLREQAAAAFDHLHRAGHVAMPADALRRHLGTAPISPDALLDRLRHVGWNVGVLGVPQRATADVLLHLDPDASLLVDGGELCVVTRASPRRREVALLRLGDGRAEVVPVDRLLGGRDRVDVLTFAGADRTYLTRPTAAPHGFDGHGHGSHADEGELKGTAGRLFALLRQERRDLWTILAYAVAVGLTSLVIPLVSQALIDAISLGVYTNQVVVLGAVVAAGMLLNGGFGIVQHYAVDLLQRRILVRTGLEIAHRLPLIHHGAFRDAYAPELVNRFFDVVNVQKSLAKLLLDGLGYALVAVASLTLLAVYSPFFLALSVLAVLFLPVAVFGLGRGGLGTSVRESHEKYDLARWLEEVGRAQTSFKLYAPPTYVQARADAVAAEYVRARGAHFRVLVRQSVGSVVFRTVMTLMALGIGGLLVIDGQLTLGQFVAAELALLSLLAALERIVAMLEHGFDLLTGVHKLSHVTDLPTDPPGGDPLPRRDGPMAVALRSVSYAYGGRPAAPFQRADLEVAPGERVNVIGENGGGKTTLAHLLLGVLRPTGGMVALDGLDLARADLHSVRQQVGLALSADELFDGTIEDNITMGRPFAFDELWEAVRIAALDAPLLALPDGLRTPVVGSGRSLPGGVVRRIMIARAVIGRPRLLVLDDAYEGLEPAVRDRIVEAVYGAPWWTVIDTSDEPDVVRRADTVYLLGRDGRFEAAGAPEAAASDGSPLALHQPEIAASLRALPPAN